jgi:hypothetical protein
MEGAEQTLPAYVNASPRAADAARTALLCMKTPSLLQIIHCTQKMSGRQKQREKPQKKFQSFSR